jgi:23S rRNA (pseudouridine1915-N3)-methyltransferase
MKITISAVYPRHVRTKSDPIEKLHSDYLTRISRYSPCEAQLFNTESAFFIWFDRQAARTTPYLVLLDSRGKQLSSEELAETVGRLRDSGTQRLVFAIGPADGWSEASRARANLLLSFGRITLPHQLARVVLAEQVYRAFTILAGHPYHSGH